MVYAGMRRPGRAEGACGSPSMPPSSSCIELDPLLSELNPLLSELNPLGRELNRPDESWRLSIHGLVPTRPAGLSVLAAESRHG